MSLPPEVKLYIYTVIWIQKVFKSAWLYDHSDHYFVYIVTYLLFISGVCLIPLRPESTSLTPNLTDLVSVWYQPVSLHSKKYWTYHLSYRAVTLREKMPVSPKQRKIAIVGSRSVGMLKLLLLLISGPWDQNLLEHMLIVGRQIFSHSSVRWTAFCRELLSYNRKHVQPNYQTQRPRFCNRDCWHSWSSKRDLFFCLNFRKV